MSHQPDTLSKHHPEREGSSRKRILVVDDESEVAEETLESLRLEGFDGLLAQSAHAALSILKGGERIDVVVTDIKMPDLDGLAFVSMLTSRTPSLAVVVMTGHASADLEKAALEAGASRCFQKPCDLDDLAAALRELLESHACRP